MRRIFLAAAALSLAACNSSPSQVDSDNPTVTYKYFGDPKGSQYEEVSERADSYCDMEFSRAARLRNVDQDGDANFATFECV
jgi:hypothetical protein